MIIGKVKISILVLCVLMLVIVLVSCEDNGTTNDILDDLISRDELGSEQDQEDYSFAELYRIVLPEAATPELVLVAENMRVELETATNTDAEVVYDYEILSQIDGTVEILLGRTSRPESVHVLKGMRDKDYIIEWYGEKLVVGGVSYSATIDGVNRFCKDILPLSTVAVLMSEEQEISFVGDYALGEIKLCGFDLGGYQIIYADGRQSIAKTLSEEIREESGYLLDVVNAKNYAGGKYISIGKDPAGEIVADPDAAVIAVENNCLYLLGYGDNELNASVTRFKEMLFSGTGMTLSNGEEEIIRFNYPEIGFQTLVCDSNSNPTISKINSITAFVDSINSDFVLFTEVNSDLFDMVAFGMSSFHYINTAVSRKTSLPVLYDPSRATLVGLEKQEVFSGGRMVWGEFRLGNSKESFLVMNCYVTSLIPLEDVVLRIEAIATEKNLPFIVMLSSDSYGGGIPQFSGNTICAVNQLARYGYAVYASEDFYASEIGKDVLTASCGVSYEKFTLKKIK